VEAEAAAEAAVDAVRVAAGAGAVMAAARGADVVRAAGVPPVAGVLKRAAAPLVAGVLIRAVARMAAAPVEAAAPVVECLSELVAWAAPLAPEPAGNGIRAWVSGSTSAIS